MRRRSWSAWRPRTAEHCSGCSRPLLNERQAAEVDDTGPYCVLRDGVPGCVRCAACDRPYVVGGDQCGGCFECAACCSCSDDPASESFGAFAVEPCERCEDADAETVYAARVCPVHDQHSTLAANRQHVIEVGARCGVSEGRVRAWVLRRYGRPVEELDALAVTAAVDALDRGLAH